VKPEEARTFLVELGHNAEALKTAKDEDVVKTYKTVNENVSKRTAATLKAEQEKGDQGCRQRRSRRTKPNGRRAS
jgi:hypothetical protein